MQLKRPEKSNLWPRRWDDGWIPIPVNHLFLTIEDLVTITVCQYKLDQTTDRQIVTNWKLFTEKHLQQTLNYQSG